MSDALAVLYVDDDPDIRAIATMSLELDPGVIVKGVGSGAEALALLAAEDWRPNVILLDVMMPEMDGPTLAGHLRRIAGLEHVPLLFMTARARDRDLVDYYALGATGVISKPFDPMELAPTIRRMIADPGDGTARDPSI